MQKRSLGQSLQVSAMGLEPLTRRRINIRGGARREMRRSDSTSTFRNETYEKT